MLDERGVVMGHLAVERARGRDSPLAPWMAALPAEWVQCASAAVVYCVPVVGRVVLQSLVLL